MTERAAPLGAEGLEIPPVSTVLRRAGPSRPANTQEPPLSNTPFTAPRAARAETGWR